MRLFEDRISSAVSRVRIGLALKGVPVETEAVSILGADARSRTAEYRAMNPQGLVPALLTDEGELLTQSLAILEYLDERYPEPPLLPTNLSDRARTRAVALTIAADTHPLLTPRVAARLKAASGVDAGALSAWNPSWITEGFDAVEALLSRGAGGRFAVGDRPSFADIVLFPQAINAERAGLALERWPRIAAVMATLRGEPAFAENAPAPRT